MSSTMDVYQPCPCGSGKKLKFCCAAIAPEMEKIERLRSSKQPAAALKAMEGVLKKAPANSWALLTKAQLHLDDKHPEEARNTLEELLRQHPEQGEAALLYAHVCYAMDGYEASLPIVQRALQRAAHNPHLASLLVLEISESQAQAGKLMSARQYLALGLRWVPEELRQSVFVRLMQFERDRTIPYPIRSVHHLLPWKGTEEANKDFQKATRLAMMGCWEAAAKWFTRLAEQAPDNAPLWQNAGLCQAWMGDEAAAAELLHRAARSHTDREAAIEAETLAQLLAHSSTKNRILLLEKKFTTGSVARLLTRLSQHPRLTRDTSWNQEEAEPDDEGRPLTAEFDVLDRPSIGVEQVVNSSVRELPRLLGGLQIYDAVPEKNLPASIVLQAIEPSFDECLATLTEAGGEELQVVTESPSPVGTGIPRELYRIDQYVWLPDQGIPVSVRRRLAKERWSWIIDEIWANEPQAALEGKTPRQAVGDAHLALPLTAAIYVLDALCQQRTHTIDIAAMCREYQLPEPEAIHPTEETEIQSYSAMQLHRVVIGELNDDQLVNALNRLLLISHHRFLHDAIVVALGRPAVHEKLEVSRLFDLLVSILRSQGRRTEALEWLNRSKELVKSAADHFEKLLSIEVAELSLRAEEPEDPALHELLRRFYTYYVRKLPQVTTYVDGICEAFGVTVPPEIRFAANSPMAGIGETKPSGLWTPETAASSAPAGKLWLPGQ